MIALLRDLVVKDGWLKLLSLALAVLIWLTISFAIQKEYSPVPNLTTHTAQRTFFDLPVVILSSAEDPRNFKVEPKAVEVTVEGDVKRLENLEAKEIRALVDLSGIESAQDLLKRIEISTPPGVTHVRVAPQEVKVIIPPKS